MGRKLNLSHLSEEECEKILGVLQKDFQVRRAEKKRVNAVHNELVKEQNRIAVLKENPKFNDTSCIVCLERFGIFIRRKKTCYKCLLNVCPSCCSEVLRERKKVIVCAVCSKEKAYRLLSNEWLGGRSGKGANKNYGTAKVVRSLYKRFSSSFSDTELDSGYPPSSISSAPPIKPRPRLDQVFDLYRGVSQEDDDIKDKDDEDDNDDDDDELPPSSPKTAVLSKPIARATSLDTLVIPSRESGFQTRQDPVSALPPRPVSVTPIGTQTPSQSQQVVRRAQTPDQLGARPRSQDFDLQRSKKKKGKDTHGLYKEALEGAKRSEEFKFRVKFDQLLGDLHLAIEEKSPNGLSNSFASPTYGEVMLTFRDKVKDILKGFSQRLVLAYDSFGSLENQEQTAGQVKQDISRFIEDLIGESLELTSDEAVSDLSSLSDDSAVEQNSFEDLVAQAVVSKLLENHRKEVSGALLGERNRSSSTLSLPDAGGSNVIRLVVKDQATETANLHDEGAAKQGPFENHQEGDHRVKRKYAPHELRSTAVGDDAIDSVDGNRKGKFSRHRRRRNSVESLFSNRSELIPDFDDDDEDFDDDYEEADQEEGDISVNEDSYDDEEEVDEDSRGNNHNYRRKQRYHRSPGKNLKNAVSLDNVSSSNIYNRNDNLRSSKKLSKSDDVINREHSDNFLSQQDGRGDDDVADVVKDFEELKEFVRKTQATARPRVERKLLDDSQELEVQEEQVSRTVVNHEEKSEDFHTRFAALDRVLHSEPPLPDFSQFENIDFNSQEVDPDLLSMNLAIIPEETEAELEQEEEEEEEVDENGLPGRWRTNWIFKGKGVSPYENLGRKKMLVESDQPLYMTVPNPGEDWTPWRDVENASDDSDSDLLNGSDLDKSDDEESSFYPNTSKELARISGSRYRSHRSDRSSSLGQDDLLEGSDEEGDILSETRMKNGHSLDVDEELEDIPGPIIEPAKQELKLLTDLVPADDDDPKFVIPPESVSIQEGEPVKFSCQVTGTPPVDVFWYREGDDVEELEDSEDVELSNNGDKYSATLYNISKKMGGQYMCIALSDTGKAVQYLVVTVKDNKQELKKPEFLKGLADVEVSEGQSVKFRVKVKGYPPPRISWYKDGALLRNSKACRIEKFGNRDYILTIDYATMDDDAEYSVSARNVAGEARLSAQVIVEPQSELPAKKQRLPSLSNIPSTDSESGGTSKSLEPSLTASASSLPSYASPPSSAVRKRQDQQQITHLDRKLSMTQKRVEEEANKMQEDAEKVKEQKRMLSTTVLDMLHTSEETLQHEKNNITTQSSPSSDSSSYPTQNSHNNEIKDEVDSRQSKLVNGSSPSSSPPSKKDDVLRDFHLPDTLDDFPMPGLQPKAATPGKSTLNFTIQGNHQDPPLDDDLVIQKRRPEKFTSEVNLKNFAGPPPPPPETKTHLPDSSVTGGDQDVSFDSGKDASISLASSVSSDASIKETTDDVVVDVARQHNLRKGLYSRDFEVAKSPETKKWSVTLDPFSPKAEVVNRQNEKQSGLEISITDLSPLSSQPSSKEDHSGQSSPRQSVDSGIFVHRPKEHPAPVHMVGDTSEHDVPESRTEFNVDDGAIELPSVNRLRAMFSSGSQSPNPALRDDLGDGSFKRRRFTHQNAQQVHSITARSVPKQQLENLRAMNQSSPSSSSSSSSTHLQVPGMASKSSAALQLASSPSSSSPSPSSSSSSSSKVTVKSLISPHPAPAQHQSSPRISESGKYEVLEPGKEPVLIYPTPESSSHVRLSPQPHQQTGHQNNNNNNNNNNSNNNKGQEVNMNLSSKSTRAPEPPPQGRATPLVSVASSSSAQPKKPPRAQPRLIVRRASEPDEANESGRGAPRIKSGCISARAAFWEKKIVDGSLVDSGEFPDMVEESDS